MVTGPLFKCFGSKWLSGRLLPPPKHPTIVEPFAGGAGYSLRHWEKDVVLCERDPYVYELWRWLIEDSSEALVREIPIGTPEGTDVRTMGLTYGQQLLLKNWQRTNNFGDCWTVSAWGHMPGQWTESCRARVAEESQAIKHWKVRRGTDNFEVMDELVEPATWFIDPPYEYNYQYRGDRLDYTRLAAKVNVLRGHIIACEAVCPTTGAIPTYLPFRPWARRINSRRANGNRMYSSELIYESNQ